MGQEEGGSGGNKRKRFENAHQQFGGRNKKKELGRGVRSRQHFDKRKQNEEQTVKRQRLDDEGNSKPSVLPGPFSQEEIDNEVRRPKHKVAVMIGYSGTGYRGMQINTTERTIEGDLFSAFVKAGAISKANANDPKKSGLVRCARTDKGVHAAGNIVSLKLIVEDEDIVEKINSHLSDQIRVWGIERTVGSFSCYQACDSRWYEYLIPSHAFLPPPPASFLGRKIVEVAQQCGDLVGLESRQEEVSRFWEETDNSCTKPIVDGLESPLRELVMKALYETDADEEVSLREALPGDLTSTDKADESEAVGKSSLSASAETPLKIADGDNTPNLEASYGQSSKVMVDTPAEPDSTAEDLSHKSAFAPEVLATSNPVLPEEEGNASGAELVAKDVESQDSSRPQLLQLRKDIDAATKKIRQACIQAKRQYRIPKGRMTRIRACLEKFLGTQNFHNYTVQKSPKDPSAKRHIKSFTLDADPKIINGTEWLSLKIHGQSFMMHQIRKMIGAITLVVRCGCPPERITETLRHDVSVSIPKVPGLGLLLERPVFQSYNENTASKYEREPLTFSKYENEIEEFKQREIYERIFREEREEHAFFTFFGHIDTFKDDAFLWVTSEGVPAAGAPRKSKADAIFEAKAGKGKARIEKVGAGLDSEDEEDMDEQGRADMDG